jgi:hypothetical protein
MFRKLLGTLFTSVASGAVLSAIGLAIWYVRQDSKTSLQDTLFLVGAVPIAIFSMGQFGKYFGRGDATYQLSRSVSNQSASQRTVQNEKDIGTTLTT